MLPQEQIDWKRVAFWSVLFYLWVTLPYWFEWMRGGVDF